MDNIQNTQKRVKISKISLISKILFLVGILVYLLNFPIAVSGFVSKQNEPLLMIAPLALWITAFTLGIIDIIKNKKKSVLSIITVVFSGIPLVLFIFMLLAVLIFGV